MEKQSAKIPGRPIFNDTLARVEKGEAQGIICWKLDRLARNPVDGGNGSWLLQQGIIQNIQTHDRSFRPTDNVLMTSVEFGMANQFILNLKANTKRGLYAKAKRGDYPGNAPAKNETAEERQYPSLHLLSLSRKHKTIKCSEPAIREELLDSQLSNLLQPYKMPPDWTAELSKIADKDEKEAAQSATAIDLTLRNQTKA